MSIKTVGTAIEIDPGWITGALRSSGATQTRVTAVRVECLAIGSAAGELARLILTYDEAPAGPATVIYKAAGRSPVQQAMDAALGLSSRERFVYAHAASELPVRLPQCFNPSAPDDEPLLLEDLAALQPGDQVTGMELDTASQLVDTLAAMHARFWDRPTPAAAPERLLVWSEPAKSAMVSQLVASGIDALRAGYRDRIPGAFLDAIAAYAARWTEVLARCQEGPQTFVHNDFRLDNIFFEADGTPVVIDWQLAGRCRGTQDLAYLIASSMSTEAATAAWEGLVERYYDRLLASGIDGYSLEQCKTHYRQSALFPIGPGMALLGQMQLSDNDARGLADSFIARACLHAHHLDAFATI
ncbi:MAG: phosphotransferase [Solirubrobacteraceae bacterium]